MAVGAGIRIVRKIGSASGVGECVKTKADQQAYEGNKQKNNDRPKCIGHVESATASNWHVTGRGRAFDLIA
jgi:hypothetical protein